jgi:recombination protein RecT
MSDVAVAEKPQVHPVTALENSFNRRADELRRALPAHISTDHFIRVVTTAVQLNLDLLTCDRTSLWNECLKCAQDGLLPDNREAALIPFKSKVTYIPMVYGLLKKFRNSGQFKWVDADIVYQGDEFHHYKDETGPHFKHTPGDERDPKKIRRIYATATTKDGGFFIEDMTPSEVQKRRNMSRASREDAPWNKWPEEMMKKTALRSLAKLLPMSSDIDALMERDEAALLGVESIEEARTALAERPSTQAMLDQFGGDKTATDLPTASAPSDEPDATDSPSGTEGERPPSEPAGAKAAGEGDQEPHSPTPAAEPKWITFQDYLAMVQEKCALAGNRDALRAWFVSDEQRKLRNRIGLVEEQTKEARAIIDERVKQL